MATRLPSAPPILPGLAYIRPLGSGGFADVFLYEQDMPRRDVAVKVLPSDVRDPDLRRMFNAEADVLAHLSAHPSIVTVYQAGISADGRPYIVMEFCPGSLAQRYRIERIPVDEVLDRSACGWPAPSSPPTARASSTATSSRATSSSRPSARPCSRTSASRPRCRARPPTRCWRCRSRGARPRWSPSRPPGRSRARCGASARRSTRCWPGTVPFERRERGQNTKEQLRRRIARATLHRHRAHRRAGIPPGRPRARDEPRPAPAVRLGPRVRRGAARGAGRARHLAHAARDRRRRVGSRHPARSTSPTPTCADPRAATSSATSGARPAPAPASPASPATRTPSSPRRARPRSGAAVGRRGRRRRVVVAVGGVVTALLADGGALMRRRTICGTRRRRPLRSRSSSASSVVWPGLDAQETPEDRHVGLGAADRRGPPLRAREHHRRRTRHRAQHQQPDQVAQTADGAYLFSRQLQQGHQDRCGAAGRPRRRGAAQLAVDPCRHDGCRDRRRLRRLPHRLRRGLRRDAVLGRARPSSTPSPPTTRDAPQYTADAIAVDERGILFSYSRADGSVLRYDIARLRGAFGRDPLDGDGITAPAITAAGDAWAVVDTEDGDVWLAGSGCRGRDAHDRRRSSSAQPDPDGDGRLPRRRDGARARRRSTARP